MSELRWFCIGALILLLLALLSGSNGAVLLVLGLILAPGALLIVFYILGWITGTDVSDGPKGGTKP